MTGLSPMRFASFLTPLGWATVAALGAGLVILLAGLRWDPFDLAERRLERAQDRAAVATRVAEARALETEGERALQSRVRGAEAAAAEARIATVVLTHQARSADDAPTPLSPARADRLRAHDRELCRIAPRLDGCPAAAATAGGGRDTMRPAAPAGRGDAG